MAALRKELAQLKAIDAELAVDLTKRLGPVLAQGQLGRFEQAHEELSSIFGEIQDALEEAAADPAEEYQKRVDRLTPGLKIALQKGGDKALNVKLKFSEANMFSRKKDFPRANALLDEVEDLIGVQRAPKPAPGKAEWDREFALVEPKYLAAVRSQPEKAGSFRAVMSFANGKAETGDYVKAIEALRRLSASMGAGENESEEEESEESGAGKAEWDREFALVEPKFLAAVRSQPEKAGSFRAVMSFANGKAEAGDYAKAIEALRRLSKSMGGEDESEAEEDQSDQSAASEADWNREFALVEPRYLAAVRSQPEKAGSFRAVMGFANGKAEAGDYVQGSSRRCGGCRSHWVQRMRARPKKTRAINRP